MLGAANGLFRVLDPVVLSVLDALVLLDALLLLVLLGALVLSALDALVVVGALDALVVVGVLEDAVVVGVLEDAAVVGVLEDALALCVLCVSLLGGLCVSLCSGPRVRSVFGGAVVVTGLGGSSGTAEANPAFCVSADTPTLAATAAAPTTRFIDIPVRPLPGFGCGMTCAMGRSRPSRMTWSPASAAAGRSYRHPLPCP